MAVCLMSFSGCGKNCKDASYQFKMDESFHPEKDSINIGDTLWLYSSHSTTFTDITGNSQVDFSNSQIGANIEIVNFPDTSQEAVGAVNNFDIVKINGNEVGNDNIPTQNKSFYFEEINSYYVLKLGFIAKQKGIYAISLGNSIGIVQKKGTCEKAGIEIDNNNLNNHLYYYQNFRPGYQISDYEKTHIYCFKVN
jgi:hypothetical protein